MSDQDTNPTPTTPAGGIPPKQVPFKAPEASPAPTVIRPVLRRPGDAPESAPKADKGTAHITMPGEAPEAVSTPSAASPLLSKKATSRIAMPGISTGPSTGDLSDIRTVRVKPLTTPQPGSNPLPEGPKPPSPAQVQAAKSKTSRISLEAALGAVADAPAAGAAPKTIRLKRPTDMPTGRITAPIAPISPASAGTTAHIGGLASTATAPIPNVSPVVQVNQTARMPTSKLATQRLAEMISGDPKGQTQRKTIKVKRPSSALKVVRGGEEGATGEEGGDEGLQTLLPLPAGMHPIAGPDTAHWTFVLVASLTIILSFGLLWVLAAQTFGPNAAVTGFARPYGIDLPSPIPGSVQ